MSCPYKNIFGKVKEGVHSYRIFDFAVVDTVLTLLLAFFLARVLKQNVLFVFTWLLVIGVFVHKAFCVETTLTKLVLH
jgi:hypothetical protein